MTIKESIKNGFGFAIGMTLAMWVMHSISKLTENGDSSSNKQNNSD